MGFFNWLFKRKPKRPKLGIALGSGGAKGFAELGALRAFEENGIEFDYVAGASIGSIIGAFYAEGYTSTDIFELLKKVDAKDIKSTFMLSMNMSGLYTVIDNALGSTNIEELKKPFVAIATVLETNEELVLDKGNVAQALCASSCYPPFFKPVVVNGQRLVDGAFTNSVPSDVVRKMGADIVIGIDLSDHEAKPSALAKIFPTFESKVSKPWEKGYQYSDVMLHPDLKGYTSLSFQAGSKMFEIGYECATLAMSEIKNKIKNFK